jgi:zinc transporter ZupT
LTDDVVHGINRAGGRTWADLVFYAAIGAVAGGILAVIGWLVYQSFGYIPLWVPASMASSILWVPWMM